MLVYMPLLVVIPASYIIHRVATPLRPWVGIKKDRCIIVAHCTCMAGIEEACSHVAGLLEANTSFRCKTSCSYLHHFMLMVTPSFQDSSYEPIAFLI